MLLLGTRPKGFSWESAATPIHHAKRNVRLHGVWCAIFMRISDILLNQEMRPSCPPVPLWASPASALQEATPTWCCPQPQAPGLVPSTSPREPGNDSFLLGSMSSRLWRHCPPPLLDHSGRRSKPRSRVSLATGTGCSPWPRMRKQMQRTPRTWT